MTSGLDAEKLEILRRWGAGLEGDLREEVSAAGRAILLLIEEIERLHVLVWDKRLYPEDAPPALPAHGDAEEAAAADESRARWSLSNVLRDRLQQREADEPFPQPESASEGPFHS